ncbi:uncharacterized protein PGTG_09789 [Puccinia graminis f. sp. tritici CRL 75-36-700-3]|uniref:Uncharacterized protein n=1 Tax=Puccinia graminis f. sp. tritici (strain CRL 75-36-700-3 / race SCCL) TaxID=418459 RepID=E3KEU6_PUCGT|nr:uncharacterized protein PGTG_09789 [Puccinia graminis f. sp. tritici CRL 75-36-700-3]EFP82821.2 hypothetical protein PGTG_09789 [Puccinia graminis f. sp. tritici CRL 75-36-700-3]
MKRKSDSFQKPACKKGKVWNPANQYHCTSGSEHLDLQAQTAMLAFHQGYFQIALESFTHIYQAIYQNSPHDSPQKHTFFIHIIGDISRCQLALLAPDEAMEILSPCYKWGYQTSISWGHQLWGEVSSLVAASRKLIGQKELVKTMLNNEQWKEAVEVISDVAQERRNKFPKATPQLNGFWSVSNAEALMWLGHRSLARKETL